MLRKEAANNDEPQSEDRAEIKKFIQEGAIVPVKITCRLLAQVHDYHHHYHHHYHHRYHHRYHHFYHHHPWVESVSTAHFVFLYNREEGIHI